MYKYITTFLLILIISCKHDPFPFNGGPINPGDTINPPDTNQSDPCHPDTVYFENEVLPLLVSNCATSGCHDAATAQKGVILTDYTNIVNTADVRPGDPNGSDLYEVIVETDPSKIMPPPPASALNSTQTELIRKWILQGAKNNACDDCDSTDVRFSTIVLPIMAQSCQSCHGTGTQNGGVSLLNYNEVKNAVMNRNLWQSINHETGFKPMPPSSKISDCQLRQIGIWINDGMPNN